MKHEWKKHEKRFYLPKNRPEKITIPNFNFFSVKGKGNPNDDEPATFQIMKKFAEERQLKRRSKTHREIYLSDARKTPPEKLKIVLRILVE